MKRPHYVTMGPPIEVVPHRNFSRMGQSVLEDAWIVCGPSASHNLRRLEIWQVIAAAYAEGLQHGSALVRPPVELRGIDA